MSTQAPEKPVEKVEPVQFASVEELTKAIPKSRELVNEYSALVETHGLEAGEAKFFETHIAKPKEDAKTEDEPVRAEPEGEPEKKDDKSEVAPAEKGAEASVSDAEKKIKELENQLEMYRGSRIPELENRLRSLESAKNALEEVATETRRKTEEALKTPLPDEITLDDLGDDIDLLDSENQKKVLGQFKKLAAAFKTVNQQLKDVRSAATQAQADAKLANTTVAERGQRENELDEIDVIRRENRELFSDRPIKDIEDDFHGFMIGLAKTIGFKGKVEENGVFAPEIQAAYTKYHSDKDLQAKAEADGIKLPEDFNDLVLVHKLRLIKNENRVVEFKDGKETIKPWSYRKALEYLDKSAVKPDPKFEQARSRREAEERAIENRKKFGVEIDPGKGAQPIDTTKISAPEFEERVNKFLNPRHQPAAEEREWLEMAMKLQGLQPEEISAALEVKRQIRKQKKE